VSGSALSTEPDGVGITPNAVARAIEDLQRRGYRPLLTDVIARATVSCRARRCRRNRTASA
jgi:hypothetical protein